jgi:hypothetical protein
MLAFSQTFGKIVVGDPMPWGDPMPRRQNYLRELCFLQCCLAYVRSNGLNSNGLSSFIEDKMRHWQTAKCTIYFQWSDSPELILATHNIGVIINCSNCHNWHLEMLKTMAESRLRQYLHLELPNGQTFLTEYTRFNKIDHVKYLLSLDIIKEREIRTAFNIACENGNEELIQLFQNYFEKQRLNLQIAELQNTLYYLQTKALTY